MGLALTRTTIILLTAVIGVGVLLTLILVPLSFQYISRNTMGFKKSTTTNSIDLSVVFHNGRYHWGLGKTAVTFPSAFVKVSLTGDAKLSVFTETGQTLTFESVFFYRLVPSKLRLMYINFGTNYHQRVVAVAKAALRNAAADVLMDQYINDRANVTSILYAALSTQLASTAFVEVPESHFALLGIDLPDVVVAQKTTFFLNTQQLLINNYTYQSSQIRLGTAQQVRQLENAAELVMQDATATVTRLVSEANSRAFQATQTEKGKQLQNMIAALGLSDNHTAAASLIELNTILDTRNNITLLRGVSQASIVQFP